MALSARAETFLPWIAGCGVAAFAATGFHFHLIPEVPSLANLFSAAINVAGISIGFMATMKAVLLGLKNSRTVRGLKKLNRWKGILSKVRWAILLTLFFAVVSSIVLMLDPVIFKSRWLFNMAALVIWGFFAGSSIGASFIVISILFLIVEQDDEDPPATGGSSQRSP